MSRNIPILLDTLFAQARLQPQAPPMSEMIALVAETSSKGAAGVQWLKWLKVGAIAILLLWILLFALQQFQPSGTDHALTQQKTSPFPSANPGNSSPFSTNEGAAAQSDCTSTGSPSSQSQQPTSTTPYSDSLTVAIPTPLGEEDYALRFDGNSSYAEVPSSTGFEPESTLTVEAWVKVENIGDNLQPLIWKQFSEIQAPWHSFALSLGNPDGSGQRHWTFSISNGTPGSEATVISPKVCSPGVWTHLAGTYNGKQITLYVNGSPVASSVKTGAIGYDTLPLRFGMIPPTIHHGKSQFYHGLLDEIRIWNTARSAEEIKASMYKKLDGNENGLAAYWACNEGTGNLSTDSRHRYTMTLFQNSHLAKGGYLWLKSTVPFHGRTQ